MYSQYLELLKSIYRYRAMIFFSQYSYSSKHNVTIGIKDENCVIYIQKDYAHPSLSVTVRYASQNSLTYDLDTSELGCFLDMHLSRKGERTASAV